MSDDWRKRSLAQQDGEGKQLVYIRLWRYLDRRTPQSSVSKPLPMKSDDPEFRVTPGRRALQVMLGGAALAAGLPRGARAQGLPACVLTPEQMEGPFFTDARLNRSDIRSDPGDKSVREGTPFAVMFRVSGVSAAGCAPLAGAMVDVWHCDAAGAYSDPDRATAGKRFLRGYQLTDAKGVARFTTIYPGWYPGRAVHIHLKVRIVSGPALGQELTSQVYFDESVTDRVHARAP